MGSCLGPTFAEAYMCDLESRVFCIQPALKPPLYARYVDDRFMVINEADGVRHIMHHFVSNSVLQFTFEIEKSKQLAFLDYLVRRF